jgi:hypothetical protein
VCAGILTTGASDFLYDGDWVLDKRTGRGHCTIRGRETYTGAWLDNKFHGQGKYADADGNVYDGEWAHGRKDGAGTQRKVRYRNRYAPGRQLSLLVMLIPLLRHLARASVVVGSL